MNSRGWICCVGSLLWGFVPGQWTGAVFAQDPATDTAATAEPTSALTARRLQKVFESAQGLLARGETSQALTLLQTILDQNDDTFYTPDEDQPEKQVSLKVQVLHTLAGMTRDQRRTYELMFETKASELLQETGRSERLLLEEVDRRFFHTDTGFSAALRLGALYFDRGSYYSSAQVFQRLLNDRRTTGGLRTRLLIQTAVASHAAGLNDSARACLIELRHLQETQPIRLGGQTLPPFGQDEQALAWLSEFAGNLSGETYPGSWPMFRGNGERNLTGPLALPIRESEWEFRTVPMAEADDPRQLELIESDLNTLRARLVPHNYLLYPALNPIVMDGRIVFRSLGNIKSIDAESGELLWETFTVDPAFQAFLSEIVENLSFNTTKTTELRRYMMQRTWKDLTSGTLSSDGRLIYAVEEQGVIKRSSTRRLRFPENDSGGLNRLMAYSFNSGKTVWELGGPRKETRLPLAGATFLGPPLLHERDLFCLIERDGEIQLVCLSNRETEEGRIVPEINWVQPLPLPIATEEGFASEYRQLAGLSPTFAEGLLICPTGQGTIVSFELAQRLFRWRYLYEHPEQLSRNARNNLEQIDNDYGITMEDHERWIDSQPIVAQGHVLLTPNDSPYVHCLSLVDGSLKWLAPRGQDLTIAGVDRGKVIFLGRNEVHARDLETGRDLWSISISTPSGRGTLFQNRLLIPLSTAEVAMIDLEQGRLIALSPSEHQRVAGNLVAGEGFLISQSHDRIFRYQSLDELKQAALNAPRDAERLALQAEFDLQERGPEFAFPSLEQAFRADPTNPRLRSLYSQAIIAGMRSDFKAYRRHHPEGSELTRGTSFESEYRQVYIDGLLASQLWEDACRELLDLAAAPNGSKMEHRQHQVQENRWALARLIELDRNADAPLRSSMREIFQQRWQALTAGADANRIQELTKSFELLPGMEQLQQQRLEKLDPYTSSLSLERSLLRLYAEGTSDQTVEALAAHFRLLMKLEHVEQAELLRQRLLTEYGDRKLSNGQSISELSAWGLENEKLSRYLRRLGAEWNSEGVAIEGPAQDQSLIATEHPVPIKGDPGFYRHWSFFFNPQMGRLAIYDSFGEGRGVWRLNTLVGRSNELQFGREISIFGHLLVLRFADHFYVLDMLNGGREPALLHGPHFVSAPFPENVENLRLRQQSEIGVHSNGTTDYKVFDPLHRPFGDVTLIDESLLVFQKESWLVGMDPLSGEELWKHRISGFGRPIGGVSRSLSVVSLDDSAVDVFRSLDGSLLHRFAVPGLRQVFGFEGTDVIAHTRVDGKNFVQRIDPVSQRVVWSVDCKPEALFQMLPGQRFVICESGHRVRFLDTVGGQALFDRNFPSAESLISFWAISQREGCLISLRETTGQQAQFTFGPIFYNYPQAHGPLVRLDLEGRPVWERRIEYQSFNPWQAADSPAFIFQSRRSRLDELRNRTGQVAMWEIVDQSTGRTLSPRNSNDADAIEQLGYNSELSPIVLPEEKTIQFVGSRVTLKIRYPRSSAPQP